jgi:AraC-like DNA-binding protein
MFGELAVGFVPAVYAARWIALLEARGIDADSALRGTGISEDQLEDPDGRLGLGSVALLLFNGSRLANDPSLGLELGLDLQPTTHGPLGVALISCDTLGDALRLGERYMTQRSLSWGARLVIDGDHAVLHFVEKIHLGPVRIMALELVLGGIIRLGELTLGVSFPESDVEFSADYPEQPHHARFRDRLPRVLYDQPSLLARVPASWLDRPLSWREPVVKRAAVAALEEERRLIANDDRDVIERTRALLSEPKHGYPDLDEAARLLGMSSRTLRRHLAQQGVTFQTLRDESRRSRAMTLLGQTVMSVDDVATELGYADAAGFIRAFTRWTGTTPAAHRRNLRPR